MRSVSRPRCAISTAGLVLATVRMLWCSATQNRVNPSASARWASVVVSASASALVFPSLTMARSSADSSRPCHAATVHSAAMDASVNPASNITVVTGANSGIGRATALHLAEQGDLVYGTVRDKAKATKLLAMAEERGVEVLLVELDVADDDSVRDGMAEILDATGHVDVLVNNAGVGGTGVVEDTDTATYLDAHEHQPVRRGALHPGGAAPACASGDAGPSSTSPRSPGGSPPRAQSPYVASKWAFEGMSEGLAQELAPFGIRVAIIEPGVTKSAIFAKNTDAPSQPAPTRPLPAAVPVLCGRVGRRDRPVRGRG